MSGSKYQTETFMNDKLDTGQRVQMGNLTGVVSGVALEPVINYRPHFSYYIDWDNGSKGIVDRSRLTII
jgi:hypothetical protein